jgi:putative membrane protein
MSTSVRIMGLIGLLVLIGLVMHQGAGTIFHVLSSAGWILLLIVPFHAVPLLIDTLGWRCLFLDQSQRPGIPVLFGIIAIREAVNRLLPVAGIGGELVGVRLLAFRGMQTPQAAASVIVEVFLTIAAQLFFIALGLLCLIHVTDQPQLLQNVILSLVLALPLLALLAVLLRHRRAFALLGRIMQRFIGRFAQGFDVVAWSLSLNTAMRSLFQAPQRLCAALLYQVGAFIVGALESWLVLRWLGQPVSIPSAIALEATAQAVRHFVFFVPAGLGAQEAALMAVAVLLGVPHEAALALSLAKRMREILFGAPALLAWHWIEARELRDKRLRALDAPGLAVHRARDPDRHET